MQLTIDVGAAGKGLGLLLLAVLTLVVLVTLYRRVRRFFASRDFDGHDRESMRRRWAEIVKMVDQTGEMGRKLAIIEADKLLDHALKSLSMAGETMGERLKFAQYKYPELRDVWWAHKVRNQLAHEASYHLDQGTARRALKTFERALARLGAI